MLAQALGCLPAIAFVSLEFIADHLPKVTVEEVRRFSDTVEIRDAQAFAAELEAFVQERLESAELPPSMKIPLESRVIYRDTPLYYGRDSTTVLILRPGTMVCSILAATCPQR